MKVVIYAICKNEEKFVDRFVESAKLADEIVVLDTGSTDNTVKLLKDRGVTVYTKTFTPWRFDVARNYVLNLLPGDADVCISLDLDEVLDSQWRKKLEKYYDKNVKQYYYTYVWSHVDGKDGYVFYGDKIHSRYGFIWKNAVHEILQYTLKDYKCAYTDIRIDHYPDDTKSRAQYLKLLETSVKEDKTNDRNMHYLGREYMFKGQYDKAIKTLKRHLKMKNAVWKRERSASMRYIALCYENIGDLENAELWYVRSVFESPDSREPYLYLAKFFFRQNDYLATFLMCERALAINNKSMDYITEPDSFNGYFYDVASVCCYYLEMYEKALKYVNIAIATSPGNKRLEENKEFILKKI